MKLALGMIVKNEEKMLRLTADINYPVNSKIALDTGSADKTKNILESRGWNIYIKGFLGDGFYEARNDLISLSADHGFDWLMMLDADEAMWPKDLIRLRSVCESTDKNVVSIPRVNLVHSGELQEVSSIPDKQPRCIRVQSGVRFVNRIHELPEPYDDHFADGIPIYHYGWCKPPRESFARDFNYERLKLGEPMIPIMDVPCENESWDWFIEQKSKTHEFRAFHKDHPLRGLL